MILSALTHTIGNCRIEYVAYTLPHSAEPHYQVRIVDRTIEQEVSRREFYDHDISVDYLNESVEYYTSTDTLNRYPHILED